MNKEIIVTSLTNDMEGNKIVRTMGFKAGQRVVVRTRNSVYEMTFTDPATGTMKLRGGTRWAHEEVDACLSGSTWGGSMISVGGLGIGMFMEFSVDQSYTSSSIVSLSVMEELKK